MANDEPNVVVSGKSKTVMIDGYPFSIHIYRLETEVAWTLHVDDPEGTTHVWEVSFTSDKEALSAALNALEVEGAKGFMRGNNVIAFPKASPRNHG
jgi:hypothetical protein